jgi:hypothetical protein
MIKVFTTSYRSQVGFCNDKSAGDELTEQFESWISSFSRGIEIVNIHTTSNNDGWMLTIHYNAK